MKRLSDVLGSHGHASPPDEALAGPLPLEDGGACPKCGGAGFYRRNVPVSHPDFGKGIECDCVRRSEQDIFRLRARQSRLPTATLETHRFTTWRAVAGTAGLLQACQQFAAARSDHPFLALVGPPGTGKTHLALAIAWDWLQSNRGTVVYFQVENLLDALRQGYNREQGTVTEDTYSLLNLAMTASLLVLDDLGAERATEWATAKLDEIVDSRYINRRHLVLTSNVLPDALAPRIADRLAEGQVLVFKCHSYRRSPKGSP